MSETAGLMTMDEAANYLGKSTLALRNGYRRWCIPYIRFGGDIRFTRELLDRWIAERTVLPEPMQKPVDRRKKHRPQ